MSIICRRFHEETFSQHTKPDARIIQNFYFVQLWKCCSRYIKHNIRAWVMCATFMKVKISCHQSSYSGLLSPGLNCHFVEIKLFSRLMIYLGKVVVLGIRTYSSLCIPFSHSTFSN